MNTIKINSISCYRHIDDIWEIEDRAFMPKVINTVTGNIMEWIPQSGKGFGKRAHVTMKDGRNTEISLDKIQDAYEERHPFD